MYTHLIMYYCVMVFLLSELFDYFTSVYMYTLGVCVCVGVGVSVGGWVAGCVGVCTELPSLCSCRLRQAEKKKKKLPIHVKNPIKKKDPKKLALEELKEKMAESLSVPKPEMSGSLPDLLEPSSTSQDSLPSQ